MTDEETVAEVERAAIVTGGAGTIGAAIVQLLQREGYRVASVDVTMPAADQPPDDDLLHLVGDIRDPQSVEEVVRKVAERFDRLDVLVNCAGTCHRDSFEQTSLDAWYTDLDTNLTGTFLMSQAAVFPYMRTQGYGRIVNIASVSGYRGGYGPVHADGSGGRSGAGYAASKAGIINLTRWMAQEVGKWGITVNAVAPGLVLSEMTKSGTYSFHDTPIARHASPTEIARSVTYLAAETSAYISGVCLPVDGGLCRA